MMMYIVLEEVAQSIERLELDCKRSRALGPRIMLLVMQSIKHMD
jgi:hypothetical protein